MEFLSSWFGKPRKPIVVTTDAEHNEVYARGSGRIEPFMQLLGRSPKLGRAARREVATGIRELDAVTAYHPGNWAAFWIKGKGYQALGDHGSANRELAASFDLEKENPDVAREYAASCLELGLGPQAIEAAGHAVELNPEDAGLHANLALAFLIAGRHPEAKERIAQALDLDPDDQISRNVEEVIDEVLDGRRAQPRNMADLSRAG